jgi:hypothetical protein
MPRQQGTQLEPPGPAEEASGRPVPTLQTAVAVLCAIAVLLVVCVPARKG